MLELSATVNAPKDGGKPNMALAIPSSPVDRVERRLLDGRWVDARAYGHALAELSGEEALSAAQADGDGADAVPRSLTIRLYLADWVREQIAHGEVVRVDLRVWARLRPVGQRLYAWLQGTHRDSYDDAIEFYLAAPLRYTLGLRGRQHSAAASVRAALNQLLVVDQRYNRAAKWSIRARTSGGEQRDAASDRWRPRSSISSAGIRRGSATSTGSRLTTAFLSSCGSGRLVDAGRRGDGPRRSADAARVVATAIALE